MKLRTEETTLTVEELIVKMAATAVEIDILMGDEAAGEVGMFREAIPLIAEAWGLDDGQAEEILAVIDWQLKQSANDQTGNMENEADKKSIFDVPSGAAILDTIWALIETCARLERRESRERIVELTRYLKDFWALEEHIAF